MKFWKILVLPIFLIPLLAIYLDSKQDDSAYEAALETIVLRKVVHELLLNSGDSTSRILPVKEFAPGVFHLYPEKSMAVNPDTFMVITSRLLQQYKGVGSFTANVKQCDTAAVVYGFGVLSGEILATCNGRQLPKGCYYFEFIFQPAANNRATSNYWWYAIGVMVIAASIFARKKWLDKNDCNNSTPPQSSMGDNTEAVIDTDTHQLGRFTFNPIQQWLMLEGQQTMLTDKEAKVLLLLAQSVNTLVERNTLQQEVWENEGVIVTRSLDMFISKLRKKLAGDPAIKILNVHGKGYKLILDEV